MSDKRIDQQKLTEVAVMSTRIPRHLHEKLRRAAFDQRRSMNEIVVEVLEKHFAIERVVEKHRGVIERLAE